MERPPHQATPSGPTLQLDGANDSDGGRVVARGRPVETRVPRGDGSTSAWDSSGRTIAGPRSTLRQLGADTADDRYVLREEVGRGGMGRVLRVEDADLHREVAMKVLLRADRVSDEQLRRFIEEAQITSQLEHPGVLPVHDFGVNSDGELFFTMQYIRSHQTIEDIIERLRDGDREAFARWTFERRVQLVQRVCQALHYAHERGVVHRDIKPTNIMVGDHGEIYLVDWGVAKLLDSPAAEDVRRPATLRDTDGDGRRTGQGILGTPAYMAPEQVMGLNDDVDARSDLYAVTAVLYELLTLHYYLGHIDGKLPQLVGAITNKRPPDAESHWHAFQGRVPRSLSRLCRKGLQKQQDQRFQSARELERALQLWLEGNAPVVCPGTAIQRGLAKYSEAIDRRPVLLPAVTITVGILLLAWLVTATVLVLS